MSEMMIRFTLGAAFFSIIMSIITCKDEGLSFKFFVRGMLLAIFSRLL